MFKKALERMQKGYFAFCLFLVSVAIKADLPTPPSSDMANSSKDWIDIGGNLFYKALRYSAVGLGALVLVGVAFGIFKAYHMAQEKQDLGHFFKHSAVAVAAAAMGAGLIYAGYEIIPND